MNCKNCGRQNPSGSLYCQDCGHRLGDWIPPERPQKMPTPPTGIARQREGTPAVSTRPCPRCGGSNAAHLRFCNNCGMQFEGAAPLAGAPLASAPLASAPLASSPEPLRSSGAAPSLGASPYSFSSPGGAPGSVCWRCRAAGDAGADFCKFCGARYADDPTRAAAPAAPVGQTPFGASVPGASFGGAAAAFGGAASFGGAAASFGPSPAPVAAAPVAAAPAPASPGYAPQPSFPAASPAFPASSPAPAVSHAPAQASARTRLEGADPSVGTARALLVAILKDGSDGRVYPLHEEQTDIGRTEGHLVLGDDPYLSPRHARLVLRPDGQVVLRDLDSLNGVFVRLRESVELQDGDVLLLGQQVLRFEVLGETELPLGPATHRGVLVFGTPEVARIARLVQYTTEGVGRDVHYLYRDETVIGREQGDIVCTDDPFMSRRHAAITIERAQRRFVLRDLGSSNGTAVRIRGERELRPGDQFRVGRHLFRYDRPGGDGAGGLGA